MSFEEDEPWLQEQGVPRLEEPFIQKYLDGRDNLIQQEKAQRSDYTFRETLSPMAAEASAIISAIRFEEQQTLWNPEFEDNLAQAKDGPIYPGMMFSLAKERMESSKLWRIVQRMPKGALLHCHLGATGNLKDLIQTAIETPGIVIQAENPLDSPSARDELLFTFAYEKGSTTTASTPSIWSSSYPPQTPIPLSHAAKTFPTDSSNPASAFTTWFLSRTTIPPSDAISHHLGPNHIWTKFGSIFRILAGLQLYEPLFRRFVHSILRDLHADGIRWVDLRTVFNSPFTRTDADAPDMDYEGMLFALEDEIEKFKASEEGKGFWGARLIWTSMRGQGTTGVVRDMKNCIEMKTLFPELICGYDLVGQEDLGRPLADLTPELFWFKKRCMEEGVEIPFFFHAGETLGDGDGVDENLFDAVLLGTRRLGHAFSLYKHPLLIEMVKEKKILVESCPVSNEVLRLTSSILSHPLPALLSRGVPCALCNDDPAIMGQGTGMTHDFWQALQGWENLGLEGLASLAENSVRWAAYEDQKAKDWTADVKAGSFGGGIRAKRMKEWAKDFEKFCAWVVEEFGAETDIGTLD